MILAAQRLDPLLRKPTQQLFRLGDTIGRGHGAKGTRTRRRRQPDLRQQGAGHRASKVREVAELREKPQSRAEGGKDYEAPSERLRLHAHGQNEKEQGAQRHFRIGRGEGKQHPAHGTGRSDQLGLRGRKGGLQQSARNPGDEIKNEKARAAEHRFHFRTDEPEPENIHREVQKIRMHKKMRDRRPPPAAGQAVTAQGQKSEQLLPTGDHEKIFRGEHHDARGAETHSDRRNAEFFAQGLHRPKLSTERRGGNARFPLCINRQSGKLDPYMSRCLRPCLIALAALLLLVLGAVLAFNIHLQSAAMQQQLRQAAMDTVGLPLNVRSAAYTPWNGIVLRGIVMPDMENAGVNFLEASEFQVIFRLLPLLRREFVVSSVRLKEAVLTWRQNANGQWRIPRKPEEAVPATAGTTAVARPTPTPPPSRPALEIVEAVAPRPAIAVRVVGMDVLRSRILF